MTGRVLRSEGLVALRHRGYRVYYVGMLARGIGAWMQLVAIPWLAVELRATPLELGVVTACLFASTVVIAAMALFVENFVLSALYFQFVPQKGM